MHTVRPTTPDDLAAAYGTPLRSDVLEVDGRIAALGAIMRRPDGRLFANLDVVCADALRPHGRGAVLAMRRILSAIEGPLFAGCWAARYAEAPRLLRLLGFRPTDEVQDNGNRVWVREGAAP